MLPLYLKLCPWKKDKAGHPQANQNGQGGQDTLKKKEKKKKRNRKDVWYNLHYVLMKTAKHL